MWEKKRKAKRCPHVHVQVLFSSSSNVWILLIKEIEKTYQKVNYKNQWNNIPSAFSITYTCNRPRTQRP